MDILPVRLETLESMCGTVIALVSQIICGARVVVERSNGGAPLGWAQPAGHWEVLVMLDGLGRHGSDFARKVRRRRADTIRGLREGGLDLLAHNFEPEMADARVAKLVDAPGLGPDARLGCGGSSPPPRTTVSICLDGCAPQPSRDASKLGENHGDYR